MKKSYPKNRIQIEKRIHKILTAPNAQERPWTAVWNIVRLIQNNYRRRRK